MALSQLVLGASRTVFNVTQVPIEEIIQQVQNQTGQSFPASVPTNAIKTVAIASSVLPLALGILVLFAGINFLRLKNWGLAMTGAVLLLIPCCGTAFPVCVVGLPIGLWAVIALNRADIKSAFH